MPNKILDRLQCPRKEVLHALEESRVKHVNHMNPGTSPENPRMPSSLSATNRNKKLPTTNKPAIIALGNITTRQLASDIIAQQHAILALANDITQHHTITQQTIAKPTNTQLLHRKLQYLNHVLKSRRGTLFPHKMM